MFTALYQKFYFSALIILSIIFLQSCGGDPDSATKQKPTLDIPAVLTWKENQAFTYTIKANGKSPLQYKLIHSPDSQLFQLNASTGALSAKTPFDLEAPTDSDADGIYELTILVLDAKQKAVSQDFAIQVENVNEYQSVVTFPTPGADVGGFETHLHFRGYILNEKIKQTAPIEGLQVTVGGVLAEFVDDGSGNWIVETPINPGANVLEVQVLHSGKVEHSQKININNSPIPLPSSTVTDGGRFLYSIDIGGRSVLRTNQANSAEIVLLTIDKLPSTSHCTKIEHLILTKNATELLIGCASTVSNSQSLYRYQLQSKAAELLVEQIAFNASAGVAWLDDSHLILSKSSNSFYLLDTKTKELKSFTVIPEGEYAQVLGTFFVSGSKLYIHAYNSNRFYWQWIDAQQLIDASVPLATVNAHSLEVFTSFTSIAAPVDDYVYIPTWDTLDVWDINTGQITSMLLNPPELVAELMGDEIKYSPELVFTTPSSLIVKGGTNKALYKLELISGQIERISQSHLQKFNTFSDISINPDSTKAVLYDMTSAEFVQLNLADYQATERRNLSGSLLSKNYYGRMDFDWVNNIVYRHQVVSWGGLGADSTPVVFGYNLDSNTDQPIIYSDELFYYFAQNDPNTQVRLGETIVTQDPNVLWFPAVVFYSDGSAVEGVYSFDIQTRSIATISQTADNYVEHQVDDPYLSPYSTDLNGTILTEWNNGYVKILTADGDITDLVAPKNPYLLTQNADYDGANELIYYQGFYPSTHELEPGSLRFPNWNTSEIMEYSLRNDTQRLVASAEIGHGIDFSSMDFRLDSNRRLLLALHSGYLMIIDTYTGDRVIKMLQ